MFGLLSTFTYPELLAFALYHVPFSIVGYYRYIYCVCVCNLILKCASNSNKYVTQHQLMRLFVVKLILSYEQKCQVRSKFLKNLSMLKNKL